ncbi:MAG: YkgJ family cysteine cluster protein [Sideroxydans sp.]|nr:YkgJ family cysteine cluster protein [Sideroxydans sp.]
MTEQLIETAIENARATYAIVASSLPKPLEKKEAELFDWYARLKGNPLTKLRALFEFMTTLYGTVARYTPCKKGCTSCCHYPVSITDLEIEFIERGAGIKRAKQIRKATHPYDAPCPFLRNDSCSIYAHRPFVCRKHVTLTKTMHWCHPDRANTKEFPLLNFSEVNRVFDALVRETGATAFCDIREAFPSEENK